MAACTIAAAAGLPVEAMRAGVRGFYRRPAPAGICAFLGWGGLVQRLDRHRAGTDDGSHPLIPRAADLVGRRSG